MFIDGRWEDGEGTRGGVADVIDPASGEPIGRLPAASTRQVEGAVAAAARSFPGWSRLAGKERGDVLRRAADVLSARVESDAATMTLEQGKTLAESRAEMVSIIDLFRWYADQADRPTARIEPGSVADGDVTVQHLPIGPVAILTPWNFPASLAARKLAAAFAVGCTAVVKPAPETPASFLAVAQALAEAGLPAGVLNVLNGDPVRISRELIESPQIRAVSFTGSTPVGREIGRLAAGALTRATLELGGHAPVVVTADVDVAAAARSLATTKFRNAGQVCISPTRFLVERPIYDEFVEAFVDHAAGLRVGPGLDEGVQMGPMAVERRRRGVLEIVDQTVVAGATLRCGRGAPRARVVRRSDGPHGGADILGGDERGAIRPSRDHQPVRDRRGSPGRGQPAPGRARGLRVQRLTGPRCEPRRAHRGRDRRRQHRCDRAPRLAAQRHQEQRLRQRRRPGGHARVPARKSHQHRPGARQRLRLRWRRQ